VRDRPNSSSLAGLRPARYIAGRRPANLLARASEPAGELVLQQDSVMEFGF